MTQTVNNTAANTTVTRNANTATDHAAGAAKVKREIKKIKLEFGNLDITPNALRRLAALGYTSPALVAALSAHARPNTGAPSVYVGTYAKYNSGVLRGAWVDLSTFESYSDFVKFCRAIHSDEATPELMLQDFQNLPAELYSESFISEEIFDKIQIYTELCKTYGAEAVDDFFNIGLDITDFEEKYCGEWLSETAFAEHIISELYDLDEMMGELAYYFDYEAYARNIFIQDYYMSANGHVFHN